MNKEQVVKKLNKVLEKRKKEYKERSIDASKLNIRNVLGLQYRVKTNMFTSSSGNCEFNPETMEGHSYHWYSLVSKIKGAVYLNTYRYSVQTCHHIDSMREVLKYLGIKHKELEAPRGLQRLSEAMSYHLNQQAMYLVKQKYSRKGTNYKHWINQHEKQIKILSSLGEKVNNKMRKQALQQAENNRINELARQREKRRIQKAIAKLEIVSDFNNEKHNEIGYHVIRPSSQN